MHKDVIQLNIRKANNSFKKWTEDPNSYFFKEVRQMTKRKMSNIINHQGNANQNQNRYHFTFLRMAIIKKKTSIGEVVEKRDFQCTVDEIVIWYSRYER